MLIGLAFSNNNANTTTANDNNPTTETIQSAGMGEDPDTGGETGTTLPPKK